MVKQVGILQTTMVYGENHLNACTLSNELKYEKELMSKFLSDKFITKSEYLAIMSLKYVLRILPVSILKIIYKNALRKSI